MDFLGKDCPVCSKKFQEGDDIVVCPKCGAPYHRNCYKENGKCIYPALHREHKSWKEVYDKNPDPINSDNTIHHQRLETIICPACGTPNPKESVNCQKCGCLLSRNVIFGENQKETFRQNPFDENPQNPFTVFIDPMAGVSPDDDFDGVTGAELAKFVQSNTPYYMRIFADIKNRGKSRFNIMALLFGSGWYLYRKQYGKGALLALFNVAIYFIQILTMYYSSDFWKQAVEALTETQIVNPTYQQCLYWIIQNLSYTEVCLALLPSFLNIISWIVLIICGLTANRGYYKHIVKKIKKIKNTGNSEEISKNIANAGGVNTAIAWVVLICYVILTISSLFI